VRVDLKFHSICCGNPHHMSGWTALKLIFPELARMGRAILGAVLIRFLNEFNFRLLEFPQLFTTVTL
jgi:hypothetical protein